MTNHIGNSARRLLTAAAVGLAAMAYMPLHAHAQAYPSKAIRLIVPFAPGAVTDASGRLMAEELSRKLGQQVLVDNRPGASGNLGSTHVAQAEPDGYTLLLAPDSNMLVSPHVYKNLAYDPVKDFAPIGKFGTTTLVLVANASGRMRTLADVMAAAKAKSGGLNYGTSGAATNTNIIVELFKQITGTNLVHIPYKGGGPAITDLLGGQLDLVSTTPAAVAGHIKSGKLVAIAVSTPKRSSSMPDVPTFMEGGANFFYNSWLGIFAPAKSPRAVVNRLNSEVNAVVTLPQAREKLNVMGVVGTVSSPDAFANEIKQDLERWGPLIKKAGIKVTE